MPVSASSSSAWSGLAHGDHVDDVALVLGGDAEAEVGRGPRGSSRRSTRNCRQSWPVTRSMSSARTQWAEVGWYSNRVPGSQFVRQRGEAGQAGVPVGPVERGERALGGSRWCG